MKPDFINYSGNIKFLENYLEFSGRNVVETVGKGLFEEIWIGDKKFNVQNALDEIKGKHTIDIEIAG